MKPVSQNIRLPFLDGLRGAASLFVVAHHLHQELTWDNLLPHSLIAATRWLQLGHYGVDVFIVLSGFSLMIPIARSGAFELPGGISKYFLRRARRIMPPYYAAIIMTLFLIAVIPGLNSSADPRWAMSLPAFNVGVLASHLLLIHNLNPNWINKINAPMWSVATEWQIYFLFPLFLLPVWRRLGATAMFFFSAILVFTIGRLMPSLDAACPWFLLLFVIGMLGAFVGFSSAPVACQLRRIPLWLPLFFAAAAALAVAIKVKPYRLQLTDYLCGVSTGALLIHLTNQSLWKVGRNTSLGILQTKPMTALGGMSYSLYLTHSPFITIAALFVHYQGIRGSYVAPAAVAALAIILIGTSTSAFYFLFERPFVARSTTRQLISDSTLVPAI